MLRTKVLHKHKKKCFVLLASMERDHGIKPGTLFRTKQPAFFMTLKGDVDKDKVVITPPEQGYLKHTTLPEGSVFMFVDVVYDPFIKAHFLRFLAENKIVGIRFAKGKTLSGLKADYEKIDPGEELENA